MFSMTFQVQGEVLTECQSRTGPSEMLRVQAVPFHGAAEGQGHVSRESWPVPSCLPAAIELKSSWSSSPVDQYCQLQGHLSS